MKQWEESESNKLNSLDSSLYDAALRKATELAWKDPSKESDVDALWKEVFPGVYEAQFFNAEKLATLRDYSVVWRDGKPALLDEEVEDREAFYEAMRVEPSSKQNVIYGDKLQADIEDDSGDYRNKDE